MWSRNYLSFLISPVDLTQSLEVFYKHFSNWKMDINVSPLLLYFVFMYNTFDCTIFMYSEVNCAFNPYYTNHFLCVIYWATIHYTPAPRRGRGVYCFTSVRPSFHPSKIFFVAFFSVTVDGRNLIFGHKHHIGIPYCG